MHYLGTTAARYNIMIGKEDLTNINWADFDDEDDDFFTSELTNMKRDSVQPTPSPTTTTTTDTHNPPKKYKKKESNQQQNGQGPKRYRIKKKTNHTGSVDSGVPPRDKGSQKGSWMDRERHHVREREINQPPPERRQHGRVVPVKDNVVLPPMNRSNDPPGAWAARYREEHKMNGRQSGGEGRGDRYQGRTKQQYNPHGSRWNETNRRKDNVNRRN
eukprot:TRINITY_DN871_c0_g1_i1.p2 TRINITY_DN871_c0_g1~~TRINITY_DN871_c0_g1_i1.p2  ORF type:complete len:216 (+),score=43.75 TRINITY_DN871_c0_g1_i1:74-721(+)